MKTEWWGTGMVICLERGADLHMVQLMPLPLTVSCFSKTQTGFTFLVPAHLGSPGKRAVKRMCVCMSDLLRVGRKLTRPACHVQPTMRIARRCTALLPLRAMPLGQTDGRTNRRTRHRFNTLTSYAVRVIKSTAKREKKHELLHSK